MYCSLSAHLEQINKLFNYVCLNFFCLLNYNSSFWLAQLERSWLFTESL